MNSGLVYVFTGEGKGKTSAALGVVTRALLLEKKAIWVAFYKQESWGLAESKLKDKFPNLKMHFGGRGFHMNERIKPVGSRGNVVVDTASEEEHRQAARKCMEYVVHSMVKKPFVIVLDEVLNAVSDELVSEEEVLKMLEQRGETHVILTGRASSHLTGRILVKSDLVTECRKIKHPYDTGKLAVAGLDF